MSRKDISPAERTGNRIRYIRAIEFLACAALILADLLTKSLAVLNLRDKAPMVLIPGVLELRYLENRGAAFSMLTNHQGIFIVIAIAAIVLIVWVLHKIPVTHHFAGLHICLILILAGAAGNLIDRLQLGYVRDFIYFSLINFPIFNVADIYVTTATVLLIVLILFVYRGDHDFDFLKRT